MVVVVVVIVAIPFVAFVARGVSLLVDMVVFTPGENQLEQLIVNKYFEVQL